jgi:voltage-gated potassium channel
MNATTDRHAKKLTGFHLFTFALSIYVLAALSVETVCTLPAEVSSLLQKLDTAICFIFLGDFFYHFYRSENRRAFLKWGWIDFVSSIPMLGIFRWGRLIRVVRIIRILRAVRSAKVILNIIFETRAKGTFSVVLLISIVLMMFSSIAILNVEKSPGSNIKNAGDALWWSLATITTVGYGDKFPVTPEGRVIASLLMVTGVGLFGTFTAGIAAFFMEPNKRNEETDTALLAELRLLRERLEKLETSISQGNRTLPAQFGEPKIPTVPRN